MTEEQKVAIEEADSPGGAIEPVGAEKGSDQGNSYDFFEMEGEEEAMNDMGAEAEIESASEMDFPIEDGRASVQ